MLLRQDETQYFFSFSTQKRLITYKQFCKMDRQDLFQKDQYRSEESVQNFFSYIQPPELQHHCFSEDKLLPVIGNNFFGLHLLEFISNQNQILGEVNNSMWDCQSSPKEDGNTIQRNHGLEQESTTFRHQGQIQIEITPPSQQEDQDSVGTEISPQKKGKNRRPKDDNNAHKKFTTCLNKCLSTSLKRKMRQYYEKYEIKDEKPQRFWFICKLLDIQQFTSKTKMERLRQMFKTKIEAKFALSEEPTQKEIFLNQLVPLHNKSFEEFMEGNIKRATSILYDIERLRQQSNRREGIQRVEEYEAAILNRRRICQHSY